MKYIICHEPGSVGEVDYDGRDDDAGDEDVAWKGRIHKT